MAQAHGVPVFDLIFVAACVVLLLQRWLLDALIEAINNFRGGPPTPMHPSPADDGFLLRARHRRKHTGAA